MFHHLCLQNMTQLLWVSHSFERKDKFCLVQVTTKHAGVLNMNWININIHFIRVLSVVGVYVYAMLHRLTTQLIVYHTTFYCFDSKI